MPQGSVVAISCDTATLVGSWVRHEGGTAGSRLLTAQKSSDLPLSSLKPQLSSIKDGNKTPARAASRGS